MNHTNEYLKQSPSDHNNTSSKPSVIFIHGIGLNSFLWEPLWSYLSNKYNIIVYNLPGHGLEPEPSSPITWNSLCRQVISIIDLSIINKFHLVGHGIGANLAIKIALYCPERIESLNLISLSGFNRSAYLQREMEEQTHLIENIDRTELVEHLIPSLTVNYKRPDVHSLIRDALHHVSSSSYIQLLKLIADNNTIHDLASLTQPTLMLSGEKDPVYTPVISAINSSYIEKGRFFIVPNASNLTFLDQPEWTAYWLKNHIDSTVPEAPDFSSITSDPMVHSLHKGIHTVDRTFQVKQILKVQLLHKFQVSVNGIEITDGWNKRLAKKLLLYLLLSPNTTREQLYDDLWPDSELRKAQNYLRVCLNHLKLLLGQHSDRFEFLHIDREHITIRGTIRCDLLELIKDLDEAVQEQDEETKESRIYQVWRKLPNHILSGYVDDWILGTRERIEEQLSQLAQWMESRSKLSNHSQMMSLKLSRHPNHDQFQENKEAIMN
ncbi:alpha/beta hydrolase [Paenibacillus sp. N3.4]|uniref:alpha/beta hydrolase n=1 Tax=Paenibacillus sp. N3.4 TaxID=2603222 RepID=UPI0011CC01E9|nr:alpha/beta hydrolase [Paenibacillus sp. N3.4]TXK83598.1 alpha/beta fold hydrolase [Paenibacillus sp. N3.4]